MTARVDWAEYRRRLAVRQARRTHVEAQAGYSAAPVRVWHFDAAAGEADSAGQRVATGARNHIRGRP